MNKMNPKVEAFFAKNTKWRTEMEQLRMLILDSGLTEEFKWSVPCYTFEKSNVVAIAGFKEYCVLNFFKGALLSDTRGILIQAGENTQASRMIRFTSVQEITEMESVIKAYIREAIEKEKEGVKIEFKEKEEIKIPEELQRKLDEMPEFKTAFEALTPGRQRAYIVHFSEPKQPKTREARVEKCIQQILEGKEFNYQYMQGKNK